MTRCNYLDWRYGLLCVSQRGESSSWIEEEILYDIWAFKIDISSFNICLLSDPKFPLLDSWGCFLSLCCVVTSADLICDPCWGLTGKKYFLVGWCRTSLGGILSQNGWNDAKLTSSREFLVQGYSEFATFNRKALTLVSLIKVMVKIRVMTSKWSNHFDYYDYNKSYGKILPN